MMKATSMSPRSGQQAASSRAVVFLHGHQLERNLALAVTAEAAGTFVLVLAITSAAVAAALSRPVAGAPDGSLAVPVAGGLALAIGVASAGHISGAHLNPAVTLGLAINGRFPWACAPGYVIAQLCGKRAARDSQDAGQERVDSTRARTLPAIRPGALRDLVEEQLRKFPGAAFTPHQIGKVPERSADAADHGRAMIAGPIAPVIPAPALAAAGWEGPSYRAEKRSRRTVALRPLMLVRRSAATTSSAADSGTSTREKRSAISIAPMSLPERYD
jgi:hypothetical protein